LLLLLLRVCEEFSGWSERLNAENVECYCFELPGSGTRRQAKLNPPYLYIYHTRLLLLLLLLLLACLSPVI